MQTDRHGRPALPGPGCSAMSWATRDGKHLWGRNFDFNRMAAGTQVCFLPRGTAYHSCGSDLEGDAAAETRRSAVYAAVGIGLTELPTTPLLYEGINERGLMGGQLYYRGFAHYAAVPRPGTAPLQPPYAVYHLLSQCATVQEVVDALERDCTLLDRPLLGTTPPLHWAFSDRSGEMAVIEPDREGLRVYRNTLGVMTNSPGYAWHRLNLLNYVGIRDLDHDALALGGDRLEQCFSGSGARGLPGDWGSPSRFVRLAFLREYGVPGADEAQGVVYMLRLLQSVAFPLGMVRVSQPGHVTELDAGVVPYDYTIYTAVMCAESLRFYWTGYADPRVQYVELPALMEAGGTRQLALDCRPDFLRRA